MINIIPQSEVRLLKTPLEKDEEHTLGWDTLVEQTTYMLSVVQKTYTDFTYIRESGTIVVPDNYDAIYTCNYLMYKNNGFNNKYFYAFITKMEYVSENSTRIYFEIDSLQTWYFQINYNDVFVEREHVSNDAVGANTVPEDLELGDYVTEDRTTGEAISFNYLWRYTGSTAVIRDKYIVIGSSEPLFEIVSQGGARLYNGVFSGLYYYVCETANDAEHIIDYQNAHYSEDPIVSVFMIPEQLFTGTFATVSLDGYDTSYDEMPFSTDKILLQTAYCNKTNKLGNNYIPTNNKLLTYPYKYFVVNNNAGSANEYRYEDFSTTECNFNIEGAVGVGCSIKAIPMNYKGESKSNLYTTDSGKLPTCSWTNDAYTNWLTSQAINPQISVGAGLAVTALGLATGNPLIAGSGIATVAGSVKQVYEHSKIPDTAKGGTNQGDYNFADNLTFTIHKMVIKEEYARIIDNFFTKYGYKVNRVKTPNINSRRNFNYIKTIDCNFTGDLPQEDLQKIKDIFNNGITFWHNYQNYLNYSVNNDII